MKFIYGKNDWRTLERGQENCYLLTNGIGGFSSLTITGSSARNDHALLMACIKAPNHRYNMILNMGEKLIKGNDVYDLTSQEYMDESLNRKGFKYESMFSFEDIPEWIFDAAGIEVNKKIAMKQQENTIAVKYVINNVTCYDSVFEVTPYMEFVKKGETLSRTQKFIADEYKIQSNNLTLNYETDGEVFVYDTEYDEKILFSHDERDGRDSQGCVAHNHKICFKIQAKSRKEFYIIYSMNQINESVDEIIRKAVLYRNNIEKKAGLKSKIASTLVKSADMFVVKRESTGGKSIIAGYPFFEDWGRDTMISLAGCCIYTKQFDNAKSIFRTFIHYCNKGLMPNLFPEGSNKALYNTVDAALLFINTVYDYYRESKDIDFINEVYPVMEDIIYWYRKGTDFDIFMDEDGLISSGSGFDQVTWMDVRVGDILPTPRHGKCVEINAYWYSAIRIMDELATLTNRSPKDYLQLSKKVKKSFNLKFWNEEKDCLRDVLSVGDKNINKTISNPDNQIRCNMIWAVSMNFTMLDEEKELKVVDKVFEKLYTPYGLRTLSTDDAEFKGYYGGEQLKRDLAYHQGTVWVFPLGAYYNAYLKVHDYSEASVNIVKSQLMVMEACLREGCIGQIPEIYDGENPTISKGCFAQAWSVAEILKVYYILENRKERVKNDTHRV